jgi:hypothetical protein
MAMTGPVVDTLSAQEFQREILGQITPGDIAAITADLHRKSSALRDLLLPEPAALGRAGLRQVLRWVFATRREADRIIDQAGPEQLAGAISTLLDARRSLEARFRAVDELLDAFPGAGFDLPGELLHFVFPDQYWLWTRWIWDPRTETGALPLVITDDLDLNAGDGGRCEVYLAVGQATAFVDETGKAVGFTGSGSFGADVFLAAVYGVYMYTVLRMRMTQEFNRVLPPLPDLIRRLLGVYHPEV